MEVLGQLWNQFLMWPIINVMIGYYKLFEALRFPGALGFAIIAMTATFRVLLYPIFKTQLKSAQEMAKLKPKIDELSKKHKNDKQALQQAQLALYKEHGVNPAGGCLPLLLQMPILIALYRVFFNFFATGDTNQIISSINEVLYHPALKLTSLDLTFFGFNLAVKPSEWQAHGWWLLAIPVITGGLQYFQTKQMMMQNQTKNLAPVKKEGDKKDDHVDTAAEMQKQMAIISPIMFGFFAYQFPIGLALYWNIFGLFGMIQQRHIQKKYG